jgi:transposase
MDRPTPLPPELLLTLPDAVRAYSDALNAALDSLQRRLADLETRRHQNSTNSSKPPSTDPPAVKRAPPKTPSGKKAGGQPGHAKNQRPLHERPDLIHHCKPTVCRNCRQPLHGDDPQPLRHQVWDVPLVQPIVTEYRRHRLRCSHCGLTSCGQAPAGQDGPRLRAACALLTGAYRLSKAKAARLLAELFGVPMSPGQVCAGEAEVGQQLRPVGEELLTAARQQPANVDETSLG